MMIKPAITRAGGAMWLRMSSVPWYLENGGSLDVGAAGSEARMRLV